MVDISALEVGIILYALYKFTIYLLTYMVASKNVF